MVKVYITQNDPFIFTPNTDEDLLEQFGGEFVLGNDINIEIPNALYEKWKLLDKEYWEIQYELFRYYNQQYKEK